MNRWIKRSSALVMVVLLSAWLWGAGESIEGLVKDNTGGVIPGVTVVLTSTDTGASRQVLSDDGGNYVFTNIKPGNYTIKAELEGFQPVKIEGIKLDVGGKLSYPITMSVSQVTTEVVVQAEVDQVETTTSALDTVIDEKRILDLPLNGRNPLSLVYLTPGVSNGLTGGPSANGSRDRGTNYQLDGLDNNDTAVSGNIVSTNVDATSEFRVITSNPSAEYGRAGGAIIDMVTKSGTNEFHGNAYIFNRSENLDAATYNENINDLKKGDYKRNQFGGSIGGPIVKDKVFFFFNTEIYRMRNFASQQARTPTQEYRDTITNPFIAQLFQQYYPLPNTDISSRPGVNGVHAFGSKEISNAEQYTFKVDYNMSEAHAFSARYFYNPSDGADPWNLPTTSYGAWTYGGRTQAIALDWTWIISPTLVNNFKLGYNRLTYGYYLDPGEYDLGFNGYYESGVFTDWGNWGYDDQVRHTSTWEYKDTFSWNTGSHSLRFGLDFRFIADNGFTNFGLTPALFFENVYGNIDDDPAVNIAQGQTGYFNQSIYGNGTQFFPGQGDLRGWRSREYDFFIQDDWKILPNLTVNLGLRYEWKPAPYEVNNLLSNLPEDWGANGYHVPNMNNFFDPNNFTDGDWQGMYYWWYYGTPENGNWQGTGTTIFQTSDDQPLFKAPKWNFAPRIGFSWDPFNDGKTAVRGGYGMSFDRLFDNLLSWNTAGQPFGYSTLEPTTIPGYDGVLPNGAAYLGNGVPVPPVQYHFAPAAWQDMTWYNYNWNNAMIMTWSFGVQREILPGHILSVTYAGSAGQHLLARNNPNAMYNPTPEFIADLAANGFSTASVPGWVRYTMVQNSQFYIPYVTYIDNYAHSNYNGMLVSFNRRFQAGLQATFNYTWSKAFDNASETIYARGGSAISMSNPWQPGADRGYSGYDVRHNFNCNVIYELPFGPGKWLGGDTTGWVAGLIQGWQVNAIVYANSGYPLDFRVARDTLGTGQTSSTRGCARPWLASTTVTTGPYADSSGQVVGPTAANFLFSRADINLYNPTGDYYRGFFRGPGYFDVDFSLFKNISLPWFGGEKSQLQVRAEAFNLFNHSNYTIGSRIMADPDFGVTYYTNANRQVQLAMKFIF